MYSTCESRRSTCVGMQQFFGPHVVPLPSVYVGTCATAPPRSAAASILARVHWRSLSADAPAEVMPLPSPYWWERALGVRVRYVGTGDAMLRHRWRLARNLRDTDEDETDDEDIPVSREEGRAHGGDGRNRID